MDVALTTVNTDEVCPQITDVECPLFTGLPVGSQDKTCVSAGSSAAIERRPRSPAFFFSRSR